MDTTQLTPIPDLEPPTKRRWRRRAALAVALLLLLGLLAASLGGSGTDPATGDGSGGNATASGRHAVADEAVGSVDTDAAEDAADADENPNGGFDGELSDGDVDGTDDGSVDLDPTDDPSPDPCADVPSGASLLVTPDPLSLPSGQLSSTLKVRNCGAADVHWSGATKPSVTLATAGGTLAPGELTDLGFEIQKSAWAPGAIDFKIKVSEPGHNQYVDVHAFRSADWSDFSGSQSFSAGPGVGGCNQQCITKAALSTGYSSPDVGLAVKTTVPTTVRVYLSPHAAFLDQDGNPAFGTSPKAVSGPGVQTWTTSLGNLAAHTKYFIIVKATDTDGASAYRYGSFTTITPVQIPDGGFAGNDAQPGCAAGCITKATVSPGNGVEPAHLVVATHTPAKFKVLVSTSEPTKTNGVPGFAHTTLTVYSDSAYRKAWQAHLSGLEPATEYHIIVIATDANDRHGYATGAFTTDGLDVKITIHQVHITQDGDAHKLNRGEISLAWGVGDDTAGTRGEHKMNPGDNIGFPGHDTYTVHDATGTLPTVYVTAIERDADGLGEFCTMGYGIFHSPGSNGSCDAKWNVASASVALADLGDFARCSTVGIEGAAADRPCLQLVSTNQSDDYPEFTAIVSFDIH